jgi:hypothetical protein
MSGLGQSPLTSATKGAVLTMPIRTKHKLKLSTRLGNPYPPPSVHFTPGERGDQQPDHSVTLVNQVSKTNSRLSTLTMHAGHRHPAPQAHTRPGKQSHKTAAPFQKPSKSFEEQSNSRLAIRQSQMQDARFRPAIGSHRQRRARHSYREATATPPQRPNPLHGTRSRIQTR